MSTKCSLCQTKAESGQEKGLAHLWRRQRITTKPYAGRGQESKWEIPVKKIGHFPCIAVKQRMKSICIAALVLGLATAATAQTPSTVVVKGTVVLPNGEPAAGADVGLQLEGGHLLLALQKAFMQKDVEMLADTNGHFSFSTEEKPLKVYALNTQGYAMISVEALSTSQKIVLQPWGRVEGIFQPTGDSGSNWWISMVSDPLGNPFNLPLAGAITGSNGNFTIEHVPPGEWAIGRQVQKRGGVAQSLPNLARTITVKPGETTRVDMAATGRIIIAKLAAKAGQAGLDWREASVALSNGAHTFGLPDGSFRLIGVPAGTYQLGIAVITGSRNRSSRQFVVAERSQQIIVPETAGGQNSAPLDLGVIMLDPVEPPREAPHL